MTNVLELEKIKIEFIGIKIVAEFICDYFEMEELTEVELRLKRKMYGKLHAVLFGLICDTEESLDKMLEKLQQLHIENKEDTM